MNVNIYDFDKTIYDGDSSIDFFLYCLKRKKSIILILPKIIISYVLYFLRIKNKKYVKENYFSFLKKINNVESFVSDFWSKKIYKIKKFYLSKSSHESDIVITASPEFLIRPLKEKLNFYDVIGSVVNPKTGKFESENCKGEEKVKRFNEKYNNFKVINTYTDSYSDIPIINIADNAYLVKKEKIRKIK